MTVRKMAEDLLRSRHEHIEMMSAAFVKQVGIVKVLDYELVESTRDLLNGRKTIWYFRKRSET